jgi:hypothetical protein
MPYAEIAYVARVRTLVFSRCPAKKHRPLAGENSGDFRARAHAEPILQSAVFSTIFAANSAKGCRRFLRKGSGLTATLPCCRRNRRTIIWVDTSDCAGVLGFFSRQAEG